MRINKKLTSINEKQESTIKALKEVKKKKILVLLMKLLLLCKSISFEVRRSATSLHHKLLPLFTSYLGFGETQQRAGYIQSVIGLQTWRGTFTECSKRTRVSTTSAETLSGRISSHLLIIKGDIRMFLNVISFLGNRT